MIIIATTKVGNFCGLARKYTKFEPPNVNYIIHRTTTGYFRIGQFTVSVYKFVFIFKYKLTFLQ